MATAIIAVAFVLCWFIPERPLRKTVETGVGEALGGPVDTDSVRELTLALSRAAGRERTLRFLAGRGRARRRRPLPRRLLGAAAAGRAGRHRSIAEIAALPHVRTDRLGGRDG